MDDEQPWKPIGTAAFLGATGAAAGVFFLALTGDRWVPVLDGANLLFHEGGHPIFGMFADRWEVYGGTLGQLAFPIAASFQFWKQRQASAFFLTLVWLLENFMNIARYMADARAQRLPLVGNGDRLHDWAEILGRWGALQKDTRYANLLTFASCLALALLWKWYLRLWREAALLAHPADRAQPLDR